MQKFYIIFFFLICFSACKNPHESHKNIQVEIDVYSCDWGKTEAQKDFEKDSLMLFIYGFPSESSTYYWQILSENYDVHVKGAVGCSIDDGIKCYNEFMQEKIKLKYGEDIFDLVSSKAGSMYYVDCNEARNLAELDLKKGKLMLFENDNGFVKNPYYWKILESKYHILKNNSEILSKNNSYKCYNNLMEQNIKKKYGEDFFNNIANMVDSLEKIACEEAVRIAKNDISKSTLFLTDELDGCYTSTEFWDVLSKKLKINFKQDLVLNSVEDKACYNDYVLKTFSDSLKKVIYKISDSLYAKDCELISKIVQQEVNNNQYFLCEFIDYPSSNSYWQKLKEYGIYKKESKNKLLKRSVDWCYNELMGLKIQEKFGKDFLKNIYNEEKSKVVNHNF